MASSATMLFCKECNNILEPHARKSKKELVYACSRTGCGYMEAAESPCIYNNSSEISADNKLDIVQKEVTDDPTLQRSHNAVCEKCNYSEAVFFQADEGAKSQTLSLIFVCCHCGHKWTA